MLTICRLIKTKLNSFQDVNLISSKFTESSQPEHLQRIRSFWEKEMLHNSSVCYNLLNEEEKVIHNLHEEAVKKGHFTYYDPKTNERILTRLRHFLRGKCCGNACRHCVYNHDNVIDEYKLKVRRFNSSFWTYPDEKREPEFDDSSYFDGSYLKLRSKNSSPSTTFDFSKR